MTLAPRRAGRRIVLISLAAWLAALTAAAGIASAGAGRPAAFAWAGAVAGGSTVMLALVVAWLALRAAVPDVSDAVRGRGGLWLLAIVALLVPGLTWGWPGGRWAADEVGATRVLAGLEVGWSGGWHELYPPLHYYVLGLLASPVAAIASASGMGWYELPVLAIVDLQARVVSLAMGLGALVVLATVAARVAGRNVGWPAAALAATFLPFVYYAKTGNVDVPYLFWFVLSLAFLEAALAGGKTRDVVGVAVTAALAVTTKDQAYGLYLFPLAHLAWRAIGPTRGPHARLRPSALAWGGLTAVGILLVVHNVAFNLAGAREHFAVILGSGSQDYRMVPATLAGQGQLAVLTLRLLWWGLGAAGVGLLLIWLVPGRGRTSIPAWWWLPSLSYYVSLLMVIGYAYDRFLLPVLVMLAVPAGAALVRLHRGWPAPMLGRVAAVGLAAVLVWRTASVNMLLLRDGRYEVEQWLTDHAPAGAKVATAINHGYLPRLERYQRIEIRPTAEATMAASPDFVVVNQEFVNRYPADGAPQLWLKWLGSADSPFVERLRVKSPLGVSALAFWPIFADRQESAWTNLDKANPETVVFARREPHAR